MSQWGFTPLQKPQTMEFYKSWIEQEQFGEMTYLKTHLPLKENPQEFWPLAKTALVFAKAYLPFPESAKGNPLQANRMALYAQGKDYHHWFKNELQQMTQELEQKFPGHHFLAMTDSSPVLERDLGHGAGLGWFGKNTCLIHPKKGSFFFLGEIYTDLPAELAPAGSFEPLPDFCGKCTRCLDACPTGALSQARQLDARLCISYLTIESKSLPSEELRPKMGDWLFGCDICQTVCPWNQKIFKSSLETEAIRKAFDRPAVIEELRLLLTLSGKQLQKKFNGTALQRAGGFGLRRNAIIVATNLQLIELKEAISKLSQEPRLSPLVEWSLKNLK